MNTRVKLIIPSDFIEDISNLEGFSVSENKEEKTNSFSHHMDLGLMDPDTLTQTAHVMIGIVGFLSSTNGALSLINKIRKYYSTHKKSEKKIRIVLPTKSFVIDANSNPEQYEKIESFFTQITNQKQ